MKAKVRERQRDLGLMKIRRCVVWEVVRREDALRFPSTETRFVDGNAELAG